MIPCLLWISMHVNDFYLHAVRLMRAHMDCHMIYFPLSSLHPSPVAARLGDVTSLFMPSGAVVVALLSSLTTYRSHRLILMSVCVFYWLL